MFLWRLTHEWYQAGQFINLLWESDCNTVSTDVLRTRHCSIWSSHDNHCYHPRSKHSPRENPHSWRHTGRTRSPRIDVTISRAAVVSLCLWPRPWYCSTADVFVGQTESGVIHGLLSHSGSSPVSLSTHSRNRSPCPNSLIAWTCSELPRHRRTQACFSPSTCHLHIVNPLCSTSSSKPALHLWCRQMSNKSTSKPKTGIFLGLCRFQSV